MRQFVVGVFLTYLRLAAKIQLWKIKPKHIIGITGSAGKSSCREAVYAILKDRYRVKQSSSGNSETGLPLDILGFTGEHNYSIVFWLTVLLTIPLRLLFDWRRYDVYVAEMGVDSPREPKNMGYLLKIFRPDVGVFLNVLPVHTEYFQATNRENLVKEIAREKGKLIESLPDGWAVLNADDPSIMMFKDEGLRSEVETFGKKGKIKPFLVGIPGYILPEYYGYNLAAAAAVGKIFGVGLDKAKDNLRRYFRLPPGRMSVFVGIKKTTILDSSYNSSRVPVLGALHILKNYLGGRKVAVLGDMRELGELAREEHEEVAAEALKDTDYIFTFGPLTEKYFPDSPKIKKFRAMGELIRAVTEFVKSGDVVLVKGSQNTILLETLVEKLLLNPSDRDRLCRRGEFWEKKRMALLGR